VTTFTQEPDRAHPIARFGARVHAVLDDLADTAAWSMTPAEQRTALVALARAEAPIGELRLRVLAAADRADIAAQSAATSTGAWLAEHTRTTRSQAHADLHLAQALDGRCRATRAALAAGALNPAHARVIVRALDQLPDDLDPTVRERAEKQLVHDAGDHDPTALKMLARHLYEVIDPDAADAEEGRRLEREEHAAARATYLQLCDNRDGTHTGRFKIPTLHAQMLAKALHALTAPTRAPAGGPFSRPERLGHALCELLERYPADRLPKAGGVSATVLVLLDYDKLLTGLGAAHLATGVQISAAQARRLACSAGLIPLVYRRAIDGPSVILDMGRKRRLHTEPQRIALTVRDRGCTTLACDRPAAWCHVDLPGFHGQILESAA
jgi:hypothetical protein